MKKEFIFILVSIVLFSCQQPAPKEEPKTVKNIILLIGDGMGATQVFAAYTANKGKLNLDRSHYVGFIKTSSANKYITDSGAGATAFAIGQKTNNGVLGIDSLGQSHETILEAAQKKGLSTGLIVTSNITHATPAAFVAHINDRDEAEKIATFVSKSNVDVLIGGGRKYFDERSDGINLMDSMKKDGYSVCDHFDQLSEIKKGKVIYLKQDSIPKIIEGRGDFLLESTQFALNRLNENPNGFFVMIEGSQIDWGGHKNDGEYVVSETIDFDKAVGAAFDFADRNPGTLVIVTADHETGGLTIIEGDITTGRVELAFSTKHHTPVMVPVYTYGTGAESFSGIYENTELYHRMMKKINGL